MYQARGQMEAAEKRMVSSQARVNESMRKMGQTAKVAAIGGVAALTAVVAGSVKVAADFDKSMRNVNSIAGLNEKQFRALSKSVLELSGKTAQAPKTLADGMYQLVSSGFNARDSLKILKSSAVAASAGLTTTETATTAVAAALNAYHLPASKAGQVSDQLFQTVNRGVITFEELSHTIGLVLPFANSLHIGLGQVGASISTMTKEGIPAAEATTYLKNAMVAFLKPSKDLQGAIKQTGAASGEALVHQKGFQGALEAVAATTDGTKGALQKLFPDIRASATAFALTGTNAKTAEGDVKAFGDTAGATQKVFAEQSKSAAFQWQKFKAELQTAGVVIGSAVLPVLSKGISAVASWVEHLSKTGQLASFGHAVAAGFKEAGQVFSDVAGAAKGLVGVLLAVGRALDLGDATHLEALLAAIAGFKIAGTVAPLVMGLATGIRTLMLNVATAPSLAALFADLPIGPVGIFAGVVSGLAAAFVLLGGNESTETELAHENAAAKKAQADAIRDLSRAEQDAADKGLAKQQADLNVKGGRQDITQARQQLHEAQNMPDGPAKVDAVASAHLRLSQVLLAEKQNVLDARGAHQAYAKSVGSEHTQAAQKVTDAYGRMAKAQERVNDLQKVQSGAGGRTADPRIAARNARDLGTAQAQLTARTQDYVQMSYRALITDTNRNRLMAAQRAITSSNVLGVGKLVEAMRGIPKSVQAKILLQNQNALAAAGTLASKLRQLGDQPFVAKVLAKTKDAEVSVEAFRAKLKGVPASKILSIIANAKSKQGEIDALRTAISRVKSPSKVTVASNAPEIRDQIGSLQQAIDNLHGKNITNTITTVHKDVKSKRAAGRSAGAGETALVGEGGGPEWVLNPQAGTAAFVTQPTVMALAPEDYVIPTESRYRGRALGLLADVAASIGAAFAGGKKGKHHRFVPSPGQYLKLSPDQYSAADQAAQQHLDSLRQKEKEKDSKGHHTKAALHARSEIGKARRERDKAHAEYLAAKRFAARISAHEQEADIASTEMGTADARGDEPGYKRARGKRLRNLRWTLRALEYEHGRAKPGSQWERDIRQSIAQIKDDLQTTASAKSQDTTDAASSEAQSGMTAAEESRLGEINKAIALAALTPDTGDDIAAAQQLVTFLGGVLSEDIADPTHRGGDDVIANIAGELKTAQDNLKALTDPGSAAGGTDPDTQAQIDQANQRAANAEAGMASQAALLQVLGGSGDLGIGGARTVVNQTINTLHPGDPRTVRAIGDAAVAGFGYQAGSPSPRERIGA